MKPIDEAKTRLVFETDENRYIWESPYLDVTMDDILNALYGMLVSATWQPETVIKCMKDFAEEHDYLIRKDDEYDDLCEEDPRLEHFGGDGFRNPFPLNNNAEKILPKGATDITW